MYFLPQLGSHIELYGQVSLADRAEIGRGLAEWGYTPTFFSVATGEGLGDVAALLKDKVRTRHSI